MLDKHRAPVVPRTPDFWNRDVCCHHAESNALPTELRDRHIVDREGTAVCSAGIFCGNTRLFGHLFRTLVVEFLTPGHVRPPGQVKWPNLQKSLQVLVSWPEVTWCQNIHKICRTDIQRAMQNMAKPHAAVFHYRQKPEWALPNLLSQRKKYVPSAQPFRESR